MFFTLVNVAELYTVYFCHSFSVAIASLDLSLFLFALLVLMLDRDLFLSLLIETLLRL